MKKTLALLLAMALSCSMAFTGCGSSQPAEGETTAPAETESESQGEASEPAAESTSSEGGKTFTWNLAADPKTIDPTLNSASDGGKVIMNSFEGLLRDKFDGNGLQPAMAEAIPEAVENADGTVTYTFKLRDAKWSDGQPVRAQDFVFSWQRAVDPATAAEYAYILSPILNADQITAGEKDKSELGVKAVDDKTLEVTLKQPCGYFFELLNFATFMPLREDIVGTDTEGLWAKDPAKAVSNGPFTLKEYKMGDSFTYVKNENYWDAENVHIDTMVIKMIVDQSTYLTAYRNGELDFIDAPPAEEVQQLLASGECQLYPLLGNYFYAINAQTTNPALQNQKVRQALSMAIDRKALVENVTRSGEIPALGIVPSGIQTADGQDFREAAGSYYYGETADIEGAKALLAEAGYPDGAGVGPVEIIYNTMDTHKAIAEAIQEMWKAIGVEATLSNQEWAVFQDTRTNLKYDGVVRHGWNGDYADPMTFLDMFVSGNPQSGCGYASEAYDQAIAKAASTTGEEHYAAFMEAEKQLVEDAYIIPLYFQQQKVMASEKLTNWGCGAVGKYWFGNADIAE